MLPRESVWRKKFENQRRDLERKVQAQLTLSPLQAWSRCEYWNVTLVKAQKLPDSLLTSDVTNLSTGKGFPNLFILLLIYAILVQDPDEKLNHRSRWEKDLVNLWKHCARLNFYFIFFILFNIAQSYIHATVPLCFGPEVQSEPCHMRGLACTEGAYQTVSQTNYRKHTLVFEITWQGGGLPSHSALRGWLAMGLPGGAQSVSFFSHYCSLSTRRGCWVTYKEKLHELASRLLLHMRTHTCTCAEQR